MNRLIALATSLLLVAGCAGDSAATTVESVTTSSSTTLSTPTSITTTTAGPVGPVVRGPSAYVIGYEVCQLFHMEVPLVETRPEAGVEQGRDGVFTCTVTNNDPRVAGTAEYTLNQNRWGTGSQDGTLVQWGEVRIENDNGSWSADYVGIYTSETGDVVSALFTGSGDYEGLSYYRWSFETFGSTWPTEGVIFPSIPDA